MTDDILNNENGTTGMEQNPARLVIQFGLDLVEGWLTAGAHVVYIVCMALSLAFFIISLQEAGVSSISQVIVGVLVALFATVRTLLPGSDFSTILTVYGIVATSFACAAWVYRHMFKKQATHYTFKKRMMMRTGFVTLWYAGVLGLLMLGSTMKGMLWHDLGAYGPFMLGFWIVSLGCTLYIEFIRIIFHFSIREVS